MPTYEFMYEQHVHHKQTASTASSLASAVIKNKNKQTTNYLYLLADIRYYQL